jgi:acyl-CoA dehydrogenase
LKRKEKISARLGDVLSQLYLCSAVLWRYEQDGRPAADAPIMHWAIRDAMFKAQNAIDGVLENFPSPLLGALMRRVVFPLGRPYVLPSDALGHEVASRLIEPGSTRDRLTAGMFIGAADEPVGLHERALAVTIMAEPVERKLADAMRSGALAARGAPGEDAGELAARAVSAGVITEAEAVLLVSQRELAAAAVRVDDFAQDLGTSLLRNASDGEARLHRTPSTPVHRAVA